MLGVDLKLHLEDGCLVSQLNKWSLENYCPHPPPPPPPPPLKGWVDIYCFWCKLVDGFIIIISRFLINVHVQGHHPHQRVPLPGSWLVAHIADLTPDLLGSPVVSFQTWQSFSVNFILGLPCLPSTCISHTVLTTPPEISTYPNQWSILSLKMRAWSSSFASSSLDLTVDTSSDLILHICLIMALLLPCKPYSFVLVNGWVSLAWSIGLRTQGLYAWRELADVRTGSSPLNFLQAIFTWVVTISSQPQPAESMLSR